MKKVARTKKTDDTFKSKSVFVESREPTTAEKTQFQKFMAQIHATIETISYNFALVAKAIAFEQCLPLTDDNTVAMVLISGNLPNILDTLKIMLKKSTAWINQTNKNKQSALHIASYYKNVAAHDFLLKHGADPSLVDVHGYTANDYWKLSPSPEPAPLEQAEDQKAHSAKKTSSEKQNRIGEHIANIKRQIDKAYESETNRVFLDKDQKLIDELQIKLTRLEAIKSSYLSNTNNIHSEMLQTYLSLTKLYLKLGNYCSAHKYYKYSILLGKEKNLLTQKQLDESPPIILLFIVATSDEASYELTEQAIKLMTPSDINHDDGNGKTALMAALETGHPDKAKMFLAAGANIDAIRKERDITFLMHAVREGKTQLVKAILKCKPDINKRNGFGQTALHLAYAYFPGHLHIIEVLESAGASYSIQDKAGFSPDDYKNFCLASAKSESKTEASKQTAATPNKRAAKAPTPEPPRPVIIIKPDDVVAPPKPGTTVLSEATSLPQTTINPPDQKPKRQVVESSPKEKDKTQDSQPSIQDNSNKPNVNEPPKPTGVYNEKPGKKKRKRNKDKSVITVNDITSSKPKEETAVQGSQSTQPVATKQPDNKSKNTKTESNKPTAPAKPETIKDPHQKTTSTSSSTSSAATTEPATAQGSLKPAVVTTPVSEITIKPAPSSAKSAQPKKSSLKSKAKEEHLHPHSILKWVHNIFAGGDPTVTVLHAAVKAGNFAQVLHLIGNQCEDINTLDAKGNNVFHYAAMWQDTGNREGRQVQCTLINHLAHRYQALHLIDKLNQAGLLPHQLAQSDSPIHALLYKIYLKRTAQYKIHSNPQKPAQQKLAVQETKSSFNPAAPNNAQPTPQASQQSLTTYNPVFFARATLQPYAVPLSLVPNNPAITTLKHDIARIFIDSALTVCSINFKRILDTSVAPAHDDFWKAQAFAQEIFYDIAHRIAAPFSQQYPGLWTEIIPNAYRQFSEELSQCLTMALQNPIINLLICNTLAEFQATMEMRVKFERPKPDDALWIAETLKLGKTIFCKIVIITMGRPNPDLQRKLYRPAYQQVKTFLLAYVNSLKTVPPYLPQVAWLPSQSSGRRSSIASLTSSGSNSTLMPASSVSTTSTSSSENIPPYHMEATNSNSSTASTSSGENIVSYRMN